MGDQLREDKLYAVGIQYGELLMEKWGEIIILREEVRLNNLELRKDKNTMNLYITKITSLYIELYPKVIGRSDFNDKNDEGISFTDKYKSFIKYYHEPSLFYESGEGNSVFRMEEMLSIALEKLRLLQFENRRQ